MTTKSNRHKMVEVICEKCGKPFLARKQRVDQGLGRFCSLRCTNDAIHTKGINKKYVGKENGKITFNKAKNYYYVYWFDPITLKRHTTSYAHWWWEQTKGEIPEGYVASYRDGNKENITPNNIILISSKEFGKNMSEILMGHSVEFDSRVKMSIAHTGKSKSIWKKFAKNDPYSNFSKRVKERIRKRDNYTCRICKKDLHGNNFGGRVHHINGDKNNSSEDNLIYVCRKCHSLIHSKIPITDALLAFRSMLV